MKKVITMSIVVLGLFGSEIHAIEVGTEQPNRTPNSKSTKLDVIEAKITKYRNYLQNLPIEIKEAIVELGEYQQRGNNAESMTRNLLKALNDCATNELDEITAEACSDINQDSVSETIQKYKLEIGDMIKSVELKLNKLKKKKKNTPILERAIKALEDSRDILKGKS